jgi:hypothetical protein
MGDVTAVNMDVTTESSGHTFTPMAVSVCITPAAPSPLPLPYPVTGSIGEGVTDPAMRTKIDGAKVLTVGSVFTACHGNEPGTLKEVVSLNTGGPCFIAMGAPTVICELGFMGITNSPGFLNKSITVGAPGMAQDASGGGSGAGGGGGGAGGSGSGDKGNDSNSGSGGGGSSSAASSSSASGKGGDDKGKDDKGKDAKGNSSYCPDKGKKAPPPYEKPIEDNDLRNRYGDIKAHGTKDGKEAAGLAMDGDTAFKDPSSKYAFWSGGGRGDATAAGYKVQENEEGAGGLEKMGNAGKLPDWSDDSKAGSGSGVTNERLWKTVSRRSAQNAHGDVDAFVVGAAHKNNVFATTELPTLLHNDKVNSINFHKGGGAWTRSPPSKDCPAGAWSGGPVSGSRGGSFALHPTDGVAWS